MCLIFVRLFSVLSCKYSYGKYVDCVVLISIYRVFFAVCYSVPNSNSIPSFPISKSVNNNKEKSAKFECLWLFQSFAVTSMKCVCFFVLLPLRFCLFWFLFRFQSNEGWNRNWKLSSELFFCSDLVLKQLVF